MNITISGNIIRHYLENVYFINGHSYAGKSTMVKMLAERGFGDGKLIRVAHCFGESQANAFREAVMARFPGCRFVMEPTTALCSFYAEAGGLIIGLEGDYNTGNNSNDF